MPDKQRIIRVTGDQTIDWALEEVTTPRSTEYDDRLRTKVTPRWMPGGSFLLTTMLMDAIPTEDALVRAPELPDETTLTAFVNPFEHSFTSLARYQDMEGNEAVRAKEYLGFGYTTVARPKPKENQYRIPDEPSDPKASVIIIDDSGLDFRSDPENWSGVLPERHSELDDDPWVLLKVSHLLADGDLWKEIVKRSSDPGDWLSHRLILVTTAPCLRERGAAISNDLSWENCIQDVGREVRQCPEIAELARLQRVVVSFGPSGAVLLEQPELTGRRCTLAFHQELMERSWHERNRQGTMFGYGTILCVALARRLLRGNPGQLPQALRDGLIAMNRVYDKGFQLHADDHSFGFPPVDLGRAAKDSEKRDYKVISDIAIPNGSNTQLSLLRFKAGSGEKLTESARQVARAGLGALPDIPIGRFGRMTTIERNEIEGLRAIRNLIMDYRRTATLGAPPLAIAVFGKPGSGKSYAVKQLLKEQEEEDFKKQRLFDNLEFNLSQYSSPADLVGALHRVRDVALDGKIPVAFWDEFDTSLGDTPLGWLRYFLAPIEDGQFRQGDAVHRVAASIFVFAGSSADSFQEFSTQAPKLAGPEGKVTDFLSRLRGYINISDINQHEGDPYFMLQRAMVVYDLLAARGIARTRCGDGNEQQEILDIQDGVLDALLTIPRYEHGVRSLAAIIGMSDLRPGQPFQLSSLPSKPLLDMHVQAAEFMEIARNPSRMMSPRVDGAPPEEET
ncbi:hypothetical protein [Kitasatospora azatica]|uniref:hypothetical protein n=1 Tax=Kitasatospora azatica TaxID=58347 RepID=UPI000561D9AC|nr:hypothetical protein [Kitasatospora azatica]